MTSTADPEHNFRVCASLARQAQEGGARMLFLPECFAFVGARQADALSFAQPLTGPLLRRYRALARRHGLWMSLGGFQERCPLPGERTRQQEDDEAEELRREVAAGADDDEEAAAASAPAPSASRPPPAEKVHNAHLIVDPLGRVRAVYRKIHLFDVDVPDGPVLLESRTTLPGSALVVVPGSSSSSAEEGEKEADPAAADPPSCPCGPLALTTCYDLRFPEMFAALAFDRAPPHRDRPSLIAVPSAFTRPTGLAHWELLLRARAVETQCYVVAAAQAGKHHGPEGTRESYGDAMVVDPWGEVVARVAEGPQATGVAFADLSAERLAEVRRRMPIAEHRAAGKSRWVGGGG